MKKRDKIHFMMAWKIRRILYIDDLGIIKKRVRGKHRVKLYLTFERKNAIQTQANSYFLKNPHVMRATIWNDG